MPLTSAGLLSVSSSGVAAGVDCAASEPSPDSELDSSLSGVLLMRLRSFGAAEAGVPGLESSPSSESSARERRLSRGGMTVV